MNYTAKYGYTENGKFIARNYYAGIVADSREEALTRLQELAKNETFTEFVLMDELEEKRMAFEKDFSNVPRGEQKVILAIWPDLLEKDAAKLKPVAGIRKAAFAWLAKRGLTETCDRCGGSGEYSFNLLDGTRCYKCGGSGKQFPKITKTLLAKIRVIKSAE